MQPNHETRATEVGRAGADAHAPSGSGGDAPASHTHLFQALAGRDFAAQESMLAPRPVQRSGSSGHVVQLSGKAPVQMYKPGSRFTDPPKGGPWVRARTDRDGLPYKSRTGETAAFTVPMPKGTLVEILTPGFRVEMKIIDSKERSIVEQPCWWPEGWLTLESGATMASPGAAGGAPGAGGGDGANAAGSAASCPAPASQTDPAKIAEDISLLDGSDFANEVRRRMPPGLARAIAVCDHLDPTALEVLEIAFPLSRDDPISVAAAVVKLGRATDETPFPGELSEALFAMPKSARGAVGDYLRTRNPDVAAGVDILVSGSESALGKDPVGFFKGRVIERACEQLERNRAVLKAEQRKYANTSADSPQWKRLREVIVPLARKDAALLSNKKAFEGRRANLSEALEGINLRHDSGHSGSVPTSPFDEATAALEKAGVTPTPDADPLAEMESIIVEDGQQVALIDDVRAQLKAEFPILPAIDSEDFAKGKSNKQVYAELQADFFADMNETITSTIKDIRSGDVSIIELDVIMRDVERELGLEGKPEALAAIREWRDSEKRERQIIKATLNGVSMGLGLLSLVTGGITSLIAGALGALAGGIGAGITLEQAGDRNELASAGAVGEDLIDNPDEARAAYWDAMLDLVLAGVDLALAAKGARGALAERAANKARKAIASKPGAAKGADVASEAEGTAKGAGAAGKADEGTSAKGEGAANKAEEGTGAKGEGAANKADEGTGAKGEGAANKAEDAKATSRTVEVPTRLGDLAEDVLRGGMTEAAFKKVSEIARTRQCRIWYRRTNKYVPEWIRKGHSPKPDFLKMKTIDDIDVHLGAQSNELGLVGYFDPELPANLESLSQNVRSRVYDRFAQRRQEFDRYAAKIKELQGSGAIELRGRVIIDKRAASPGAGKAFTGDNDIFDIVDLEGKPLPKADYEAILEELEQPPVSAQHGAHRRWTPETDSDKDIYKTINDKHTVGGSEPLLEFGPGGFREDVFAPPQ